MENGEDFKPFDDYDPNDVDSCIAWWLRREAEGWPHEEQASVMLKSLPDPMPFLERLAEVQKARKPQ